MRRAAFIGTSAALTIAPSLTRAQAALHVTVGASGSDDIGAVLWAEAGGGFTRAHLDVDVQKVGSGAAVAAAVAGGSVDIGKSSLLSLMTARARGLPFVVVAPGAIYVADAPTAGTIVANDSPIRSGRDCNGRTFAVSALNDMTSLSTMAWIDRNGGDAKSVHFVELPPASMADAVAAGRIDGGTLPNPAFAQAVESKRVRVLCHPNDAIARRFLSVAFFATTDYIAKNRAAVTAFRRVIEEAGAYANQHREQMTPLLATYTGVAAPVLASQPPQLLGTTLDVALIQPLVDVAARYKAIPAAFDARTMIDPGAL